MTSADLASIPAPGSSQATGVARAQPAAFSATGPSADAPTHRAIVAASPVARTADPITPAYGTASAQPAPLASTATTSASAVINRRSCRGVIPAERSRPHVLRRRSTCRLNVPATTNIDTKIDTRPDRTSSPMTPPSSSRPPAPAISRPLPLTSVTAMSTAVNDPATPAGSVRTLFQASTSVIAGPPTAG
ncbi:hypothetical protein SAMN05421833_10633 [Microbispora rosea]|uniref:Uncharacterized protein n=1 Tax=Microbispora rosea TaxID=58117 RepID=A0A1N6Y8D9_9ACTN|nr:hypothetical protein [Microbispora rosea]GIH47197.1 hypothetical protein Mro03_23760 [Microbispora rosea subsp. rosea]SIR10751.1 hypothetical protein SAMN05421833_10633 [Microbispora rosea]